MPADVVIGLIFAASGIFLLIFEVPSDSWVMKFICGSRLRMLICTTCIGLLLATFTGSPMAAAVFEMAVFPFLLIKRVFVLRHISTPTPA